MKKIIGLLLFISLIFVSCEPITSRETAGRDVTESEINEYVKVYLEIDPATGERTNELVMTTEGLQALSSFDYKQGKYVGVGTRVRLFNKGDHTITVTIRQRNGGEITKSFSVNVQKVSGVDDWIKLCGENGVKSWTWDTDMPQPYDVADWMPEPGVAYLPYGIGIYGLGGWQKDVNPKLGHEYNPGNLPGVLEYGGILQPVQAGYLNPPLNVQVLSENPSNHNNEGVTVADGKISKIAYMTFDVRDGLRFSKTRLNDATITASFNLDMSSARLRYFDLPGDNPATGIPWTQTPWVTGQLVITGRASGDGILYHRVYNATYPSNNTYTYEVVTLEEDLMVLCIRAANSAPYFNTSAFFWRFRPYEP